MFGPLLEVEMSKKCTPLWREAHFEVKFVFLLKLNVRYMVQSCRMGVFFCGATVLDAVGG